MIKIEFSFGIQLDRDGKTLNVQEIHNGLCKIREEACKLFGGCTVVNTVGDWDDSETGKTFSEHGALLFVVTDEDTRNLREHILLLASSIKDLLRQKAVLVVEYAVLTNLY